MSVYTIRALILLPGCAIFLAFWVFGLVAFFKYLSNSSAMVRNRTKAATSVVRINPLWFMRPGMLKPEGETARRRAVKHIVWFFIALAGGFATGGLIFLVFSIWPWLGSPSG